MATKWKSKLEYYATIVGVVASIVGLIYFALYAYHIVHIRSSDFWQLVERIF
ncbi:hypothetical protein [Lysinibacillus piscis]|uniref:Uncharacterized protein n=1 Tax=Lysinibacillus piscis TaxID=2518931 RepID=A0ABQ5NIH2_9BACI|nr:hypothetical protein [Lysinibacillus sp. KH24]GLC88073.1 hypothetical protein LYSBPC_12000 [Lysinibacillus sp. KH24]